MRKLLLIFINLFFIYSLSFALKVGKFEPPQVSNIQLWLDASDISTITLQGGTTQVTQWDDKSGNGNNATQAVAENQPFYRTNILNGLPVIEFIIQDYLGLGDTRLFNREHTIFIVGKHGTEINQWYFSKFAGTFDGEFFVAANYSGYDFTYSIVTGTETRVDNEVSGFPDNTYNVINVLYDGSDMYIYKNNSQVGSPASQSGDVKTTSNELFIGILSIGTTYDLNGAIAEIIVYDKALNIKERQQVNNYLLNKWGI